MRAFKEYVKTLVEGAVSGSSLFINSAAERHNIAISVRTYEDKGVQTTVRRSARHKYKIYMPLGIFYRFSLLSYILRFSSKLTHVNMILSPTDRRELDFFLPDRLKVIFDPNYEIEERIIEEFIEEYCDLPLDATWAHSIIDAVNILLWHEMGHICEGHLEFLELIRKSDNRFDDATLGYSEFDLRQGFEVSADQFAAMYLPSTLKSKADAYKELGISFESISFEFTLTIGILITLFDCRSRSLDVSSYEYHPHPLIRFTIINYAISESLAQNFGMKTEAVQYWRMAKKTAAAVVNRVGGLYFSEMRKDTGPIAENMIIPICPLAYDQSPVNESVLIDFLTRAAERGRRLTMRINQHKEFMFLGLAGLSPELSASNEDRWDHIFARLVASSAVRDDMSSGVKFSTFFGPIKK